MAQRNRATPAGRSSCWSVRAGSSASGLILDANGSSILGLVIDDFGQDGISVQGNDNTVVGDYVGVAATGMTAAGNTTGIVVTGAGNTIGG